MGFWEGFALGLMAGGVFGVIFAGVLQASRCAECKDRRVDKCADCEAETIRSLQGKIKPGS